MVTSKRLRSRGTDAGSVGHRRRWRQRVGGVLTVAVGVDAVAGDVDRAGVDVGIAVVAIAAAERPRVAVTVEVEQRPPRLQRRPHQRRARARGLARRLRLRSAQQHHQRQHADGGRETERRAAPARQAPPQRERRANPRRLRRQAAHDVGPGGETEVVAPEDSERDQRRRAVEAAGQQPGRAPADGQAERRDPAEPDRQQEGRGGRPDAPLDERPPAQRRARPPERDEDDHRHERDEQRTEQRHRRLGRARRDGAACLRSQKPRGRGRQDRPDERRRDARQRRQPRGQESIAPKRGRRHHRRRGRCSPCPGRDVSHRAGRNWRPRAPPPDGQPTGRLGGGAAEEPQERVDRRRQNGRPERDPRPGADQQRRPNSVGGPDPRARQRARERAQADLRAGVVSHPAQQATTTRPTATVRDVSAGA